jgi:hypothetical protein
MPHRSVSANRLGWCRALLVLVLPLGCATAVLPDLGEPSEAGVAGTSAEGGGSSGGMTGTSGTLPIAGTSVASGGTGTGAFGGTQSGGGRAGSGSGGAGGGGAGRGGASFGGTGFGGFSFGGTGGRGGAGAGGSATGGSGGGGSGCTCAKTVAWVNNANVSFGPGDCVTAAGKTYLYTGTKKQTYANGSCAPGMQMTWCTDTGNDYNFMLCQ